MSDSDGPRGYRDGVYFVDVEAYVLPPLIGLPFHDMRQNGERVRHRDDPQYYRLIIVHAVFMCLAIMLFIPLGIFTARFRAYKNPRKAIRSHIFSNVCTIVFLSIGFACGVVATGSNRSWTNPHHIIGLTIFAGVLLQALLGAIVHHRGKYRVTPHLPLRTMLHRWLGRAVWFLGLAQIPLGLVLYGSPLSLFICYAVYMFCLLLFYFTSEFYRGRQQGSATVTTETAYDYQYSDKPAEKKGWFSAGNLAKVGLGFLVAKKVKDHYSHPDDRTMDPSDLSSRPGVRPGASSTGGTGLRPPAAYGAGYASSVGVTNSELNGGYNRTELTDYTRTEDLESRLTPPGHTNGHGHNPAQGHGSGVAGAAVKTGILAGLLSGAGKKRGAGSRPTSPSAKAKPGFFSFFKRNKGVDLTMGASPKKPKTGGFFGGAASQNRPNRTGHSVVSTDDYDDYYSDDDSRRSPRRNLNSTLGAAAIGAAAAGGMAAAHKGGRRDSFTDSYVSTDLGPSTVGPSTRVTSMPTGGLQAPPPAQNSMYSNHRLPLGPGGGAAAATSGGSAFDAYHTHSSSMNIHNDNNTPQPPGGFTGVAPAPNPIPMPVPPTGAYGDRRGSTSTRSRHESFHGVPPVAAVATAAGLGIAGAGTSHHNNDATDSELTMEPRTNRAAGSRSYRIPATVTSSETGYQTGDSAGYMPQASLQVRIKKQDGGKTVTTIKRLPNRERTSQEGMSATSPGLGRSSRSGERGRRDSDYRVREEKKRSESQDQQQQWQTAEEREAIEATARQREREERKQRRRQRREEDGYRTGEESPQRPNYI